jgi:hypothetical protein
MEAYHGWWPDGSTLYDGANSTYGPTPGYLVGGPNQFFSVSWVSPPYGMPPLKAFKDWNTGWNPSRQANENSWEITEPAIYYQAPYLLLVSQYATAPPVAPGTGNGLLGAYYDNANFTRRTVTRTDATVNFNWGTGGPSSFIGRDTFSVRWTGQVQAIEAGTYTFRTQSDDGVRLWVNGVLLVDNWTNHAPTYNTGTIALAAGTKYDIRLEYFDNTGGAVIRLQWQRPGQGSFATVPKSQLYSSGGASGRAGVAADWGDGDGSDTAWRPGGGTKRPWR